MELFELQRVPLPQSNAALGCRRRIILLPAAFQELVQFRRSGFDTALHEHTSATELLFAAPRLAHLNDRRWLPALYEQLIAPARERGIATWLGGVSLGGYMALRLAAQYPEALDGLCLLAPYLGSRIVAAELEQYADPRCWQSSVSGHALDEDDDERRIWRYVTGLDRSMHPTHIFLGFGAGDRFADTQRLLARALPTERVTTQVVAGGHDWPVWRALWESFLRQWPDTAEPSA